jgi:hypothetical protein
MAVGGGAFCHPAVFVIFCYDSAAQLLLPARNKHFTQPSLNPPSSRIQQITTILIFFFIHSNAFAQVPHLSSPFSPPSSSPSPLSPVASYPHLRQALVL